MMRENTKINMRVSVGTLKRRDNLTFLSMCLPVILQLLIFCYLPMCGIIIAFQDFNSRDGMFGSKFVGFKHFEFFFKSQDAWRITRNTVGMNLIFIFLGLIFAVVFALMLYEVKRRMFVKTYQTILILPNFISWVIVSYMVYALLNPAQGVVNNLLEQFGQKPIAWYSQSKYWPYILAFSSLWKKVGIDCIIYYAALMGINNEYYEAAELDGATKLQQIRYISIPFLMPIVTILTILAIGGIFRADFGLFYQLSRNSGALYETTDVIDTYVFRALKGSGEIGMSAAIGLFQSVVGFVLILCTNFAVKKINPENSLF